MIPGLSEAGAHVVPASKHHARALARIIRAQDLEEIFASGGFIAEPAIRMSVNRSVEAYALYVGCDLLAVFGVAPLRQGYACWALTSIHVDEHQKTFWKCSKIIIDYLRGRYPLMMNMVHGMNTGALRWTERLGFTLSPPEKFGQRGDLFCRITMVTQPVELIHV